MSSAAPLPPQFGKAEYLGEAGSDRCTVCNQPVGNWYFRVNSAMTCMPCAQAAKKAVPVDTHAAYMRALLFGVGAAVLGMIGYATFGIVTGWVIGYLSVGVGYIIGKAMLLGSKGMGGRRYQVTAALLTYVAVSMSAVPMGIAYVIKHGAELHPQAQVRPQVAHSKSRAELAEDQKRLEEEFGSASAKPLAPRQANPAAPAAGQVAAGTSAAQPSPGVTPSATPPSVRIAQRPKLNWPAFLGMLAIQGLASPVLELLDTGNVLSALIGLVILVVGIRIAWQLTAARQVEIIGPFRASPAAK